MWLAWMGVTHAQDPCSVDSEGLDSLLSSSAALLRQGNIPDFKAQADATAAGVPCLDAPLDVEQAALLHYVLGMRAGAQGNTAQAGASFKAVRALDGDFEPPFLPPTGHPLRSAWDDAGAPSGQPDARALLPVLPGITWVVDGTGNATGVPMDRPAVLQRLAAGEDGAVTWQLDGRLPDDLLPVAPSTVATLPPQASGGRTSSWRPAAVAGGLAVGSLSVAALTRLAYCPDNLACDFRNEEPVTSGQPLYVANLVSAGLGATLTTAGSALLVQHLVRRRGGDR